MTNKKLFNTLLEYGFNVLGGDVGLKRDIILNLNRGIYLQNKDYVKDIWIVLLLEECIVEIVGIYSEPGKTIKLFSGKITDTEDLIKILKNNYII